MEECLGSADCERWKCNGILLLWTGLTLRWMRSWPDCSLLVHYPTDLIFTFWFCWRKKWLELRRDMYRMSLLCIYTGHYHYILCQVSLHYMIHPCTMPCSPPSSLSFSSSSRLSSQNASRAPSRFEHFIDATNRGRSKNATVAQKAEHGMWMSFFGSCPREAESWSPWRDDIFGKKANDFSGLWGREHWFNPAALNREIPKNNVLPGRQAFATAKVKSFQGWTKWMGWTAVSHENWGCRFLRQLC